jgi:hypothetical protein
MKKIAAIFTLLPAIAIAPHLASAQASSCPANTVEISREVVTNGDEQTTRLHCRRIDRLTPNELSNLGAGALANLSPEDRKRVDFLRGLQSTNMRDRDQPLDAPITNDVGDRSAYNYFKVIEQFQVEKSPRYAEDSETYCNIFAEDVTRAMNAPLPQMVVNDMVDWLKENRATSGWKRVDERMAQQMAKEGHPSIAIAANVTPSNHGHVAVIRPASEGDNRGAAITQAGASNIDATHIEYLPAFSDPAQLQPIQYWYHE